MRCSMRCRETGGSSFSLELKTTPSRPVRRTKQGDNFAGCSMHMMRRDTIIEHLDYIEGYGFDEAVDL